MSAAKKYPTNVVSIEEARVNKLLSAEHPLQVLPSLAAAVGLNEAIALQQVHYWTRKDTAHVLPDDDGNERRWAYNTIAEWGEQFPFWSLKTVQRTFEKLRQKGLVIAERKGTKQTDQTLWYAVDYEAISALNLPSAPISQNDQLEKDKVSNSIWSDCPNDNKEAETTTETTHVEDAGARRLLSEEDYAAYGATVNSYLEEFSPTSIPEMVRRAWGRRGSATTTDLRKLWQDETAKGSDERAFLRIACAVVLSANHADKPNMKYLRAILKGFDNPTTHAKPTRTNRQSARDRAYQAKQDPAANNARIGSAIRTALGVRPGGMGDPGDEG